MISFIELKKKGKVIYASANQRHVYALWVQLTRKEKPGSGTSRYLNV